MNRIFASWNLGLWPFERPPGGARLRLAWGSRASGKPAPGLMAPGKPGNGGPTPGRSPRHGATVGACLLCLLALAPTGCVRRRLLIRSNPPGATVYVDNQLVGTTPCATSFVYYGTREIRLVKAGYETLTVNQPIPAPWYEIPPLDFASENLTPREIQDYRTVSFNLTPQVVTPTDQLLARAEQLREATLQGAVAPSVGSPAGSPGGALPGGAQPGAWGAPPAGPLRMDQPFAPQPASPFAPGMTIHPGSGQLPHSAPPAGAYGPGVPWGAPMETVPPGAPAPSPGRNSLPPGGIQLQGNQS